jgi:hypothetical protein
MAKKKREIQKRKKQSDPVSSGKAGLVKSGSIPTREPKPAPGGENLVFSRFRENLLLGFLMLYVFLLGLGTFGELFEVEWILNLPLFK